MILSLRFWSKLTTKRLEQKRSRFSIQICSKKPEAQKLDCSKKLFQDGTRQETGFVIKSWAWSATTSRRNRRRPRRCCCYCRRRSAQPYEFVLLLTTTMLTTTTTAAAALKTTTAATLALLATTTTTTTTAYRYIVIFHSSLSQDVEKSRIG